MGVGGVAAEILSAGFAFTRRGLSGGPFVLGPSPACPGRLGSSPRNSLRGKRRGVSGCRCSHPAPRHQRPNGAPAGSPASRFPFPAVRAEGLGLSPALRNRAAPSRGERDSGLRRVSLPSAGAPLHRPPGKRGRGGNSGSQSDTFQLLPRARQHRGEAARRVSSGAPGTSLGCFRPEHRVAPRSPRAAQREANSRFICSIIPFLTPRPSRRRARVCVRGDVIASPSHYFQADCRGSLSQAQPVLAAGTRGDKGGSPDCDLSPAASTRAIAAVSAGHCSPLLHTHTHLAPPHPPPPRRRRASAGAAGCCRRPGERRLLYPSASFQLR